MRKPYKNSIMAIVLITLLASIGVNHFSLPPAAAKVTGGHASLLTDASWTPQQDVILTSVSQPKLSPALAPIARMRELVAKDPWAAAKLGRQQYLDNIRDYSCLFLKQERIGNKLRKVEEIEVLYRSAPKSIFMTWKNNADQAKRALFMDTPEFVNDKGEKTARVEPAGALIRLIVSDIMMPIHGKRAQQTSRRSIDDFGFLSTFDLLNHYNQLGVEQGVMNLRYEGEGVIDGRPTYKIVRYLPYTGPDGPWPDAKMILHLDQEWLLPTAVYSYADQAGTVLLGSYVHTHVKLNPGLDADAFRF